MVPINTAGDDNIYIFGAKADTVIDHYAKVIIILEDILNNDHELRTLVDFIVSDEK